MWQILSHHLPFPAGSHKRMVPKYDDILQKHYKPVESLILFFPVNGYVILGEADFHHRLSLMLSSILFVVLLDLQHVLYLVALVLVGQMMNYQILVFQHQHSSYKLQHLLNLQVEMLQDWYSSHDAQGDFIFFLLESCLCLEDLSCVLFLSTSSSELFDELLGEEEPSKLSMSC